MRNSAARWRLVYLNRLNHGVVYGVRYDAEAVKATLSDDQITMEAFGKGWHGHVAKQGSMTACTLLSRDGEALWGIAETSMFRQES